jgi:hypothetical protein
MMICISITVTVKTNMTRHHPTIISIIMDINTMISIQNILGMDHPPQPISRINPNFIITNPGDRNGQVGDRTGECLTILQDILKGLERTMLVLTGTHVLHLLLKNIIQTNTIIIIIIIMDIVQRNTTILLPFYRHQQQHQHH